MQVSNAKYVADFEKKKRKYFKVKIFRMQSEIKIWES